MREHPNFGMRLLVLVGSLASATHAAAKDYECADDYGCNLNGICQEDAKCLCDSGWTGVDCGVLDLQPTRPESGYNRNSEGTSSWSAQVIRDHEDKGLYHMFIDEIVNGCGPWGYSPYSRLVRAESRSPDGPFTFAQEILGTFAETPSIIWNEPEKQYIMYYVGCPYQVPDHCDPPPFECGVGNELNGESGISIMTSPDLRNWTPQGFVLTGSDSTTQWDADVTNPSASALWHIDLPPSKGVVLAYRGCRYNCSGAPDSELINVAVAEDFRGPYVKLQEVPIFPEANEDPFIWRDRRGHFHMLLHSLELGGGFGEGPKVGRHAFARYFWGPWTFNNRTLAFSTEVDWTDGTSTDFFRRERPYLLFSDDGLMTPQYLITAVQKSGTNKGYSIVSPLKGEHIVTAKKHAFVKKEEHVREL